MRRRGQPRVAGASLIGRSRHPRVTDAILIGCDCIGDGLLRRLRWQRRQGLNARMLPSVMLLLLLLVRRGMGGLQGTRPRWEVLLLLMLLLLVRRLELSSRCIGSGVIVIHHKVSAAQHYGLGHQWLGHRFPTGDGGGPAHPPRGRGALRGGGLLWAVGGRRQGRGRNRVAR